MNERYEQFKEQAEDAIQQKALTNPWVIVAYTVAAFVLGLIFGQLF